MKKIFFGLIALLFSGAMMAQTTMNQAAQNVAQDTTIGVLIATPITMEITDAIGQQMQQQQTELVNGWEIIEMVADSADTLVAVDMVPDQNNLQSIKLGLNDSVLFATGSAQLTPKADQVLQKLAAHLNNFPETFVTIVGYTSSTGSAQLNMDLSMSRAQSVMDYLVKQGVSPTRMKAIGKSWNDPVASNKTMMGRAENRRVEIWITPTDEMIQNAQ